MSKPIDKGNMKYKEEFERFMFKLDEFLDLSRKYGKYRNDLTESMYKAFIAGKDSPMRVNGTSLSGEYRYLKVGDMREKGDEFKNDDGIYIKTSDYGIAIRQEHMSRMYRRPINSQAPNNSPKSPIDIIQDRVKELTNEGTSIHWYENDIRIQELNDILLEVHKPSKQRGKQPIKE